MKRFNGDYSLTTIPKFKYLDVNDFVKKFRSLKKYCPRAYKELIFKINKDDFYNKPNGRYKIDLYTSREFKYVYGQISLVYSVEDKTVIIEDLLPNDFFLTGYYELLKNYKGIPYRSKKDKFKIDLFMSIKKLEEKC